MAGAYSNDLRQRVVDAVVKEKATYQEAAERFCVGVAAVDRWLRRLREQGDVSPSKVRGRPARRLDDEDRAVLRQLVADANDATILELADDMSVALRQAGKSEVPVSTSTISRELKILGLTRKKKRSSLRSAMNRVSSSSATSTK
jgi:transposase